MKRNTLEHPKVLELADALDLPRYAVIGILESLWCWTGRYCPRGDVGRYSNRRLATEAIRWDGDPDALIGALISTGWLDESDEHRLLIHDWADHADDATRTALEKSRENFATGESPRKYRLRTNAIQSRLQRDSAAENRDSNASKTRQPGPEPEPEPGPEPVDTSGPPAPRGRKDPPVWALEVAESLALAVKQRIPGTAPPTAPRLRAWAVEISRLEAEPALVAATVAWLYGPENEGQYRIEVQSGRALREKWGQIQAAQARARQKPKGSVSRNPESKWDERRRAQDVGI